MKKGIFEEVEKSHFQAKMLTGGFVIGFGVLILLNQMGIDVPNVLYSWKMVLILIGIVMLVKHRFEKTSAYVLIGIGAIFMINDFYPQTIETRFIWPVLIIILGISIFFKASRSQKSSRKHNISTSDSSQNSEDFIDSTAFFGGVNKNVVSKNFKGAKITSFFGGTEINLSHADFEEKAIIDVSCVFGGINIIVPSHWKVHSEISSLFGGIDDSRQLNLIDENSSKLLVLKGNCLFGGVEIRSYV